MEKSQFSWVPKKVDYDLIEGKISLKSYAVKFTDYHPLKPIVVTESTGIKSISSRRRRSDASSVKSGSSGKSSSSMVKEFIDPLSAMAGTDPLSSALATAPPLSASEVSSKEQPVKSSVVNSEFGEDFVHWDLRKPGILSMYSLDEKLSAHMISIAKTGEKSVGRSAYALSAAERLKTRLNKLNDMEAGSVKEMKTQDQQQFVDKIHDHGKMLKQSWDANQKVNALKTAIQCGKMLSKITVMQYYPSKFVLIAEVLETFGQLVFERILSMCGGMTESNIDPSKVPENAKEICSNWIMKIASIRELLPRILIEASILPCYNLLKKDECNSVLVRLTNMTKGVGNPLVALYVRAYLCMIGVKHASKFKGHLLSNYYYFVATYKQIHTTSVQNDMAHQKVDMATYLSLYMPALEWILSCVAYRAHDTTLKDVLDKCAKTGNSLLILRCILASFKPEFIATKALEFCSIISESNDHLFPKHIVFSTLGNCVVAADPPEKDKQTLLSDVWKYIIKLQDPERYMSCAVVWTEYAAKHFKKREVNTILGDILKHLTPDRAFEKHYQKLLSVIKGVLSHMTAFSTVFSMDKFLPFLDMFQKEDVKLEACKCVAEFFTKTSEESTSDPLVIDGMMYVCKAMHDSINSMSLESEMKSVSASICAVIQRVTFGRDYEQQLNFYVECRGSFHNLDLVLSYLVHSVNTLSSKATRIVRHKHTTKTASFVRACAAFCFITIPSLGDIFSRLQLYLVSGQAALISHCVAQADAMFCAAVTQIIDAPTQLLNIDAKSISNQATLVSYISSFLSTLLAVPDHPEQGMLYLLRGLMNVISSAGNNGALLNTDSRMAVYTKVLSLLSAYSQDRYLYRVDHVDSNEHLYSSDKKFLDEISLIASTLLDELFSFLGSSSQFKPADRGAVAFDLFTTVIAHSDIEDQRSQRLAVASWEVIVKTGSVELNRLTKTISSLKERGGSYAHIASKLSVSSRV